MRPLPDVRARVIGAALRALRARLCPTTGEPEVAVLLPRSELGETLIEAIVTGTAVR